MTANATTVCFMMLPPTGHNGANHRDSNVLPALSFCNDRCGICGLMYCFNNVGHHLMLPSFLPIYCINTIMFNTPHNIFAPLSK